ncbi:hypothetical protein PGTUg99_033715 [Puccinia graminis f. sp. tritici]|uniref:Uncharacterized protein n=1 Tax=Puccinia graminis f. sp. tritici TaxID=56615 RepID=A0A5B0NGR8_PUCGR|nr:hypothetical protein PGTUg99_033715 [Puccinia graminis f. sp. tritici]
MDVVVPAPSPAELGNNGVLVTSGSVKLGLAELKESSGSGVTPTVSCVVGGATGKVKTNGAVKTFEQDKEQ